MWFNNNALLFDSFTLSISGAEVTNKLGIGQLAVSRAMKKEKKLVKEIGLKLDSTRNA